MDGGVADGNSRRRRKSRAVLGDLLKKQNFTEYSATNWNKLSK
jgi:hypothetical protein